MIQNACIITVDSVNSEKNVKSNIFQMFVKIKKCDKRCLIRHPGQCKFKQRCKFLKRNICAFTHETFVIDNDNLKDASKPLYDKIEELEDLINKNKAEYESIVKGLTEKIECERNKFEESVNAQKQLVKKNDELQNLFKK